MTTDNKGINVTISENIENDPNAEQRRANLVMSNTPPTREVQFGFTVASLMRELLTIPIDTKVFKYTFMMDTDIGMTLIFHPKKECREIVTAIELVEHTLNLFKKIMSTSTSYDVNRTFAGKLIYFKPMDGGEKITLLTNINQLFA